MQLKIFAEADEVISSLAEFFIASANHAIAIHGRFSVALSGGNSPKKLFQLLASASHKTGLDWDKVDFFFSDERYVPETNDASNFKMANEVLLQPLHISSNNVFAVNTSLSPQQCAIDYWQTVTKYFNGTPPCFDLIMLGLGENSHTASLFPGTPVLEEKVPCVSAVFLTNEQVWRITMNAPLINLAKNIVFLVYGKNKAEAVHHVLKDAKDVSLFPAQLINPLDGEVFWFLDKEAAAGI